MPLKPRDDFEAGLYEDGAKAASLRLDSFLVGSLLFFAAAMLTLVVSRTLDASTLLDGELVALGSLFVVFGAALFSGWLLGALVTAGAWLEARIRLVACRNE